MASLEEDGMPHTTRDWLEVDNLHQFLQHTQTHQAPVMTTPNISNVLLEERGVPSRSERSPMCNLGVFEVTETVDTTRLAVVSENHEHVEVEGDGEGHALEVEDEEWVWSPVSCLRTDHREICPPDLFPTAGPGAAPAERMMRGLRHRNLKYRVEIRVAKHKFLGGRKIWLGTFDTLQEAVIVRDVAFFYSGEWPAPCVNSDLRILSSLLPKEKLDELSPRNMKKQILEIARWVLYICSYSSPLDSFR
jgi:hypothetical protein